VKIRNSSRCCEARSPQAIIGQGIPATVRANGWEGSRAGDKSEDLPEQTICSKLSGKKAKRHSDFLTSIPGLP